MLLNEIDIKDDQKTDSYKIVNESTVNLTIKIVNKFASNSKFKQLQMFEKNDEPQQQNTVIQTGVSMKDRLKFFTANNNNNKPPEKVQPVIKKIKLPGELASKFGGNIPVPSSTPNNIVMKKIEIPKNLEEKISKTPINNNNNNEINQNENKNEDMKKEEIKEINVEETNNNTTIENNNNKEKEKVIESNENKEEVQTTESNNKEEQITENINKEEVQITESNNKEEQITENNNKEEEQTTENNNKEEEQITDSNENKEEVQITENNNEIKENTNEENNNDTITDNPIEKTDNINIENLVAENSTPENIEPTETHEEINQKKFPLTHLYSLNKEEQPDQEKQEDQEPKPETSQKQNIHEKIHAFFSIQKPTKPHQIEKPKIFSSNIFKEKSKILGNMFLQINQKKRDSVTDKNNASNTPNPDNNTKEKNNPNKQQEPETNNNNNTVVSSSRKNSRTNQKKADEDFGFTILGTDEDLYRTFSTETSSSGGYIETFLEPINYEQFLTQEQFKDREAFCEGFFIASFPMKDGKVVEGSQNFQSDCGHSECATLPSMKPEIIFRYPLNDTKTLELNNLAASICFPTGIKVCYNCPKIIKDYVTPITNQKGERYYMLTFHFYHRMVNENYTKLYEMHPLKHHLMKFGDAYVTLGENEFTDDVVKEIQENLDICQELGFRDYVYVPFCICLISKYPYIHQLDYSLQSIFATMYQSELNYSVNDLIMYLIHSIPIPDKNSKVKFFLPFFNYNQNNSLTLFCPKIDDVIMNNNFTCIVQKFSVENIIIIFRLLLNEKKILFIDDDYGNLTKITDAFISLLYPFKWIHTYIPIMSDQMLKYLETFLPFLNGINSSLMKSVANVFKDSEVEDSEEVFLIYIGKNEINISSSLKNKKVRISKYISNNVFHLPSQIEKDLKSKLNDIKEKYDSAFKASLRSNNNTKMDTTNFDSQIRDVFINAFVEMFQNYSKYMCLLDDDVVFNKNLFMDTIKEKDDKKFYNEFIDTQLFQQFTQNYIKEDSCGYFNRKIEERKNSKKKKDKERAFSNAKCEKIYYCCPDFLGIQDNDKIIIEKTINEKYPYGNTDENFLNRVLDTMNEIQNEKYINSNCLIYLTPEKKSEIKNTIEKPKFESNQVLQSLKDKILSKSEISSKKLKLNATLHGESLGEKEIELIKENVKDIVVKIFKSEIKSSKDKKLRDEIGNYIKNPHGREFFVALVSANANNVIYLQKESFLFLGNIIYMILVEMLSIEETGKVLEQIVTLIKSTTHYSSTISGKKILLLNKMKKKIMEYEKVKQKQLWFKWCEMDMKTLKEDDENKENLKQNIIISTCIKMLKFEISKSIIKNVTDEIIVNTFGKETEMEKSTKDLCKNKIMKASYISQAKKC